MVARKFPVTWESVSTDDGKTTKRMRILGGWLVHITTTTPSSVDVFFVPDPNHDWLFTTDTDPD